jgi:hypothetical protein
MTHTKTRLGGLNGLREAEETDKLVGMEAGMVLKGDGQ